MAPEKESYHIIKETLLSFFFFFLLLLLWFFFPLSLFGDRYIYECLLRRGISISGPPAPSTSNTHTNITQPERINKKIMNNLQECLSAANGRPASGAPAPDIRCGFGGGFYRKTRLARTRYAPSPARPARSATAIENDLGIHGVVTTAHRKTHTTNKREAPNEPQKDQKEKS